MRRLLLFFLLLFSITSNASSVNFLNWAAYMDPAVPTDFTKKTGIKVNQSFYNGSSMLQARLIAGASGYDVIVPALVDMQDEIKFNLLQPLNKKWLSNYHYRDKGLYKLIARVDKGNRYGLIYQYGTTGIAYNPKLVKAALGKLPIENKNWGMLLSPKYLKKLKHCGVALLDSPTQIYGVVLHYLGLNPNSQNPNDYIKATNYLMKIRPYISYFSNFKNQQDLASGNICIAMGYSGDILEGKTWAKQAGDKIDITYMMPETGVPIWFDMLAIPKGAPNIRNAHRFMNYLISPKVIANVSNFLIQPNAVPASRPYLIKSLSTPEATPSAETVKHAFLIYNITPKLKSLLSRLWFKVKYGA